MLRHQGSGNTAKYRQVWKRLSGEGNEDLKQRALARNGKAHGQTEAATHVGERRSAEPRSRVDDILHRLESPEYQELSQLLRRDGERAWHPDLPRE